VKCDGRAQSAATSKFEAATRFEPTLPTTRLIGLSCDRANVFLSPEKGEMSGGGLEPGLHREHARDGCDLDGGRYLVAADIVRLDCSTLPLAIPADIRQARAVYR
jgi:hypothetical protein